MNRPSIAAIGTLCLPLLAFPFAQGSAQAVSGGGSCTPVGVRTDVRPDPDGRATEVRVALFMVDLTEVDDVAQTLTTDVLVTQSWTDPRLAHLEGCQVTLPEVWHPQLDFLNSGRMEPRRTESADQVEIGPEGLVQHQQRYYGSLASYHSLRDFPFDDHVFRVSLLSPEYGEDEVQLVANEAQMGRRGRLNITDWTVDSIAAGIDTYVVEHSSRRLSMYEFRISARRQVGFYIWKVIVPLALIVAMSWTVFWVSPAQFGPQIGMSATAMLTLIAFQFALVSVLPKLAYFTVLDEFIVGSTILVFVALVEAVVASYLVSQDRTRQALRLDRLSRWAFPAAYALMSLVVFR